MLQVTVLSRLYTIVNLGLQLRYSMKKQLKVSNLNTLHQQFDKICLTLKRLFRNKHQQVELEVQAYLHKRTINRLIQQEINVFECWNLNLVIKSSCPAMLQVAL